MDINVCSLIAFFSFPCYSSGDICSKGVVLFVSICQPVTRTRMFLFFPKGNIYRVILLLLNVYMVDTLFNTADPNTESRLIGGLGGKYDEMM